MKIYTINFEKNGGIKTGYEQKLIAENKNDAIDDYLHFYTDDEIDYTKISCEENPNIDIEYDEKTNLYVGTIGNGLHTQAKDAYEMLKNIEELRQL